jgi:hypothetical protein
MVTSIKVFDFGFDEGGSDKKLLVSVQLGSCSSVKRLDRHWKIALREAGNVEFFHSKDYANYSGGVFKGLSPAARKKLLRRLCRLIHKHLEMGITTCVDTAFYDSNTPQDFRSRYCSAYTFSMYMAVLVAHVYLNNHLKRAQEFANILVAHGHRNLTQALERLGELTLENKLLKVKTCGWGYMRDLPLLQAADMLAYGEWQRVRGGDLEIFNAVRTPKKGTYLTEFIDCDAKLIQRQSQGIEAELAAQKAYWKERRSDNRPVTS